MKTLTKHFRDQLKQAKDGFLPPKNKPFFLDSEETQTIDILKQALKLQESEIKILKDRITFLQEENSNLKAVVKALALEKK